VYEIKIVGDVNVEGPDMPDFDVNVLERGLREDVLKRLEEMGLIIAGIEIKVKTLF